MVTASVQWGAGNYCDNHTPLDMDFSFSKDASSTTAEVAVIYAGKLIDANDFVPDELKTMDTVIGWLSADQVLDFLNAVRNKVP